jgi:hypothetical protein
MKPTYKWLQTDNSYASLHGQPRPLDHVHPVTCRLVFLARPDLPISFQGPPES